ncbi:MAG: hypothetical protein JW819_12560 [Candidatus Krumholzibacteriota bacterium]|nr:hypothetical protein [Candidatus Krumholzibacteriota bacterium]
MKKILGTLALLLVLAALMPVGNGNADMPTVYVVVIEPGMTEFEVGGEHFLMVTTQTVRITFQGISHTHVWGSLEPLDGYSSDLVKFLWLREPYNPITLHAGILGGRSWSFDSQDVTGHNEKD